jgi:hypothetical protein
MLVLHLLANLLIQHHRHHHHQVMRQVLQYYLGQL